MIKRFMERCIRRHPKVTALVLRLDRPRAIDGVIDYFGEQAAPVLVASTGASHVGETRVDHERASVEDLSMTSPISGVAINLGDYVVVELSGRPTAPADSVTVTLQKCAR